ncbi:MAG TPA: PAS domain-containing sensor histidine kinase, partial [Chitinophagaceae bacterium]|nr:PAS domain-containing sensor histidine kinase [Chitinophagaceae bacterium]
FRSSILDTICDLHEELISVWDINSHELVFFNKAFQEYAAHTLKDNLSFKISLAELLGNGSSVDLILKELHESGIWSQDFHFKDGNGAGFLGKLLLNRFENEGKTYILQRIINIEELSSAIQGIKEEKQRFEALFQFATMAIIVADSNGKITMANKFAKALFGYEDDIFSLIVEDLIPRRFRKEHEGYRKGYNKNPTNRAMGHGLDLFAIRKDGAEFPVEVSLGHYQVNEEKFTIAFIIDISARKEIEETMVRQKEQLERSNREIEQLNDELEIKVITRTKELEETLKALEESKSELEIALNKEKELSDLKTRFVSMASHEFRTPLSTILSSASLVAKYKQSEEQDKRDKHIQRIRSAVNNLTDILNEFLSIGRIEEGKVQANFSSFNVKEHIQLVCNEMTTILKKGQRFNYVHTGEPRVYLDLSLLRNVMINLLSNAIKFSPENAVINVSSQVDEKTIIIAVKDNGLGIPEDDKKHLFERFFRANNVTNIQGTGLGLHIVSKYVELMNGNIEVDSELEKGTTFTIHFNYEQDPVDRR